MLTRTTLLEKWLKDTLNLEKTPLIPLTNDASFRCYYRITVNSTSYVVMDAPPDKENSLPFLDIAEKLRVAGLNAPQIIARDLEQGFLILTDFGSQLYLSAFSNGQTDALYRDAVDALVMMQARASTENLPLYDYRLLHDEMNLFTNWLVDKHLSLSLQPVEKADLAMCFEQLSQTALAQPPVFVHRDYHSRNLMVVPHCNPGILDFQDAVKGPITYDLVSLLRDCYIALPQEKVIYWVNYYYESALQAGILQEVTQQQFLIWFDWMGIQRHLKASGIFARLYQRDGKVGYLKDIPRTLHYIVAVSSHYPSLTSLRKLVQERVLPAC